MKILITGSTGFVGGHFLEFITAKHPGVELHGTFFSNSPKALPRAAASGTTFHQCDFKDKQQALALVSKIKPDLIFHLAAQSYVNSSWENPEKTLATNIIGQSNLFEAVRACRNTVYDPVIVIACSSEEYGFSDADADKEPITERHALQPQSSYAISKIAQDYMGLQYFKAYGMSIIRLRVFNHTGPRRDPVFGVSGFAKKIAEIDQRQRQPELEIRDLSAIRDFTDVRDVVYAYWLAARHCQAGEVYNVCSGRGISFQQILDKLLSLSTVKKVKLVQDQQGRRPTDGGVVIGSNTKFKAATGWEIKHDFLDKTLPDMLSYWRRQILE